MLDKKDWNLLELLQNDCTTCIQELAAEVDLTPNPCWKRIRRLEEEGYILKRVALLSQDKLKLGMAFVMIKLQEHNHLVHKDFTEKVSQFNEVIGFFRITGVHDYILQVMIPDIQSYDVFYKKLVRSVEGIRDVTSSFVMEQIKFSSKLPIKRAP